MIKFHSKSQLKTSFYCVYSRYVSQVVHKEFKSAQKCIQESVN